MKKIQKSKAKLILALTLLVILTSGAGAAYYLTQNSSPRSSSNGTITYKPPSKEDKTAVEENKERIKEREAEEKQSESPSTKQTVKPVITYAGQYDTAVEVGGYIDIFEEGGTCTATLTQGSATFTKSVTAVRGANSTDCPVMSFLSKDITPKGQYTVTLSYTSATAAGISNPKDITIK